jgi:endo-alpha-1,4-polygalactosaminidase (GH114 family)
VYYLERDDAVYAALLDIIGSLKLPVIINGGDSFVKRAITAGELPVIVHGVNQESVMTGFNADTGAFTVQEAGEVAYYSEYLSDCARAGLDVFLTEYAAPGAPVRSEIDRFCRKNGYVYYIAESINLDI